jgi:hypothetical protein
MTITRYVYSVVGDLKTSLYIQIINNFQGLANDSTPPFPNASDAFKLYNADGNYESTQKDQYYYHFRYGDVAFFVMDTRRYRSNVFDDDTHSRTMLGDQQLAALYDWLDKVIVVLSTPAGYQFILLSRSIPRPRSSLSSAVFHLLPFGDMMHRQMLGPDMPMRKPPF